MSIACCMLTLDAKCKYLVLMTPDNFQLQCVQLKLSPTGISLITTVVCVRESTKPILCSKWGHFDRAKPILKILLASWTFYTIEKRFRSFNAKNLGSVCQRAAKWPAFKLWEWFDPGTTRIRADWFERGRGPSADFFLRPPNLKASNFVAL